MSKEVVEYYQNYREEEKADMGVNHDLFVTF